jgi:hypothetical protein
VGKRDSLAFERACVNFPRAIQWTRKVSVQTWSKVDTEKEALTNFIERK